MGKPKYNRIKEVMTSKGIKQTWLAEQIGVTFRQFNAYANNHVQPSIEILFKISSILNVSVHDLLVEPKIHKEEPILTDHD